MRPALHPAMEHEPDRPEWTCRVDGEPWPCAAKRERWLELYDYEYKILGARLGRDYVLMVNDLTDPESEILTRLFGWNTWRSRRAARNLGGRLDGT